jgi:dihydrofolate synthase/folylpolyglutamate synthase
MIAAALTSAGYRTGLYTSPHLVDFSERIRINGRPISRKAVVRLTSRVRRVIEMHRATFFEAVTAIAFRYFAEERVDIVVIETGLGGRLDATNVVRPLLSVITNISLEHTDLLGNSLAKIAYEKAGIVKSGVPCVTGVRSAPALRVIQSACRKRRSSLIKAPRAGVTIHRRGLSGTVVSLSLRGIKLSNVHLPLAGKHQVQNAVLAITALHELSLQGFRIHERAIRRGMESVNSLTGLDGRLSLVSRNPTMIADVAHNTDAVRTLTKALAELGIRKAHIVFGVMTDKPVGAMVRYLAPIARSVAAVQPGTSRSLPASSIEKEFRRRGIPVFYQGPVAEGVRRTRSIAGRGGTILITGSHFVVGEALAALRSKKYLTINQ